MHLTSYDLPNPKPQLLLLVL